MKYLSIDIEATGLDPDCLIIEFAALPFDTKNQFIAEDLKFYSLVQCPSFEELKPKLNPWVIEHNEELIKKAHIEGAALEQFKTELNQYLSSPKIKKFFGNKPIVLFGKSLSAIDLPFLNRDLGDDFMRKYFSHRTLDLSCLSYGLIDMDYLPKGCESGSTLMKHYQMGHVCHTALEDARNTILLYFKIIDDFKKA